MPKITDILSASDVLAEHIGQLDSLAGVEILANRQKDLGSAIDTGMAKTEGLAVIIEPVRGTIKDPSSGTLAFENSYIISIWAQPVLQAEEAVPAARALVDIIRAIHHWKPQPNKQPLHRLEVTGWQITPDENFMIYAIEATLTEIL